MVAPGADVDRLRREARILAALEHPGIVPVHDVGVLADGRVYYTMKLVEGQRLDEWLRDGHSLPDRLRLFLRVCEPAAFAHARGLVHRDLKPENIMVGVFGEVLILDWGVAARAAESGRGEVAGTEAWMSPEQRAGAPADPRSDVFALGRILKAMLGGMPAPRPLASICRKATAGEPGQRYATAAGLAADVARFLDQEPVEAHREGLLERSGRLLSRHRTLAGLIAAYLLMRILLFFLPR